MFAQIVVRFPGIFRRIDLMAQLLQLNFEVVTQQGIILNHEYAHGCSPLQFRK